MSARRERSWVELDAVAPLAGRVTDNHTHLPVAGLGDTGPGSDAPLDAAALVTRAAAVGVARLITSACELPTWSGTLDMARSLRPVRAALGVHPNEAVLHAGILETGPDGLEHVPGPHHEIPLDEAMGLLETAIRSHRELVVAVGETGMDLFRTGSRGAVAQQETCPCRSTTGTPTPSAWRSCWPTAPRRVPSSTASPAGRPWPPPAPSTAGTPRWPGR